MFKCSKCRKDTETQGYCKICQKEYQKAYRIKHGQGTMKKDTRICTRCNIEKNKSEFNTFYFCKSCAKPRGGNKPKIYTDEQLKQHRREHNQLPEVKERLRRKKSEWNKANRPTMNEAMRKWRKTSAGRALTKSVANRRRNMAKVNGGTFTPKEWLDLVESYNHTCLRCRCNNCALEADHIKPLSKGGSNRIDNIQPLCAKCNNWKATQEIDYR